MGVPKISTMVIALIWISFFSVAIAAYIANLNTNYGNEYDADRITTFNKLTTLDSQVNLYKNATINMKENTGVFDVIGGYISNAYNAMKIMYSSLDITQSMLQSAVSDKSFKLGIIGDAFRSSVIMTIIVFIVIGVIISALLKKDV